MRKLVAGLAIVASAGAIAWSAAAFAGFAGPPSASLDMTKPFLSAPTSGVRVVETRIFRQSTIL